jgi:8-oxo-dGTP pyrophosphatase MutT (NUDIX family)
LKEKTLFKNKWINVIELDDGYTIYRLGETNEGVHILAYRAQKDESLDILIRQENCPPHGGMVPTGITGTVEKGDSLLETARRELLEESGYDRPKEDFQYQGSIYPSKASDFKIHLYAIDVGFTEPEQPIRGDGTKGEEGASTYWTIAENCADIASAPALSVSILRLLITEYRTKNKDDCGNSTIW